ncbi:MAG: L28 family ribosomal protein [Candidatus Omnitrophota bacterium]
MTGRSKRTFKPNVQRMRIIDNNNTVHTVYVCTKCLKAGKIRKA